MTVSMLCRLWVVGLAAALAAGAQKYDGPVPAKADLPYLKQAATLIPLEAAETRSEKLKDGTRITTNGAASPVKTPISLPIFILKIEKMAPDRLQLYRLEVKEGHREFVVGGPNPPDVLHMEVAKIGGAGLCRIAVDDPLEAGEYVLMVEGETQVYCFQVF